MGSTSSGWAAQFCSSTSCQVRPSACPASGSFRGPYHIAEVDFSGPSQTFFNMFGHHTRGWATERTSPPGFLLPFLHLPRLYQGGAGLQGVWENPSDLAVSRGTLAEQLGNCESHWMECSVYFLSSGLKGSKVCSPPAPLEMVNNTLGFRRI